MIRPPLDPNILCLQGYSGELVSSPADPQQGCVGERSAHGAAPVPTVGHSGAFFLFDTVVSDLADLVDRS